jgi:Fe-S-cluster-containing dehydrogenase component
MNSCIGCSACVTSCVSENNIAVIGKDQVRRGRIMHWMRIDRYYSSEHQPLGDIGGTHSATKEANDENGISAYTSMENPKDNPSVVHQPMMCQHCNHAGCETVCPVAATTHSNEGLNMMAYNRCIGTRYCANNCAYKVRRFNWFNYIAYSKFTDFNPSQDDLGRMVLNPDVVVRSRGVMEKCSLCVQRIQEGKLDAKKAGTKVQDGAIQTACSSACPTNAITFGDHNDEGSKLAAARNHDRSYRVIEEVGQQANVYYQTKVRNLKA